MTELSSGWSTGHNCPQTTPNIIRVPTVRDIWGLTSSQSDLQEPVWFGNGHWIKVSRIAPPPFSVSIWGMRVKFCLKGGGGATTKYGRKSNQPALDLDTITTSPISHDTLPCLPLIRNISLSKKLLTFYLSQTFD